LLFSTIIHGAAGAAHTDPLDSLSEPDREILDTLEKSPANSHVQLHVIYVGFFELALLERLNVPSRFISSICILRADFDRSKQVETFQILVVTLRHLSYRWLKLIFSTIGLGASIFQTKIDRLFLEIVQQSLELQK
jgi:hypothetical protein